MNSSLEFFNGKSWLQGSAQEEFILRVDGEIITQNSAGIRVRETLRQEPSPGLHNVVVKLEHARKKLAIDVHTIVYPHSTAIEKWVVVTNIGDEAVRVDRIDSLALHLSDDEYEWHSFTSKWGEEFDPALTKLTTNTQIRIETRSGRSSHQSHPWATIQRGNGELLTAAVAWSGNWVLRMESAADGGFRLSGGLSDWEFYKELQPSQSLEGVPVVLALGQNGDWNDTSRQLQQIGRTYWYPANDLTRQLPVEWNHWWPYGDQAVNEISMKENADMAQKIGIELCMLDAGWFGPAEPGAHWYDYRGDWEMVNRQRFPGGLRALSDYLHERGLKFGLWCEIEGVGKHARLIHQHPHFASTRDGNPLGYVCFGCREVQEWAFQTLDRLIKDYSCDWIKLDFNLDPGAGCNRTDHGHGAGDGLYEHYRGYYLVLDRIRAKHPQVILENCSSGGLRIDLGIMRHTHVSFLSDPDWPEHGLQIFWGATAMLAPNACLHWMWSEWGEGHPRQNFNPANKEMTKRQLDYYIRNSMLNGFGFSLRLPKLPDWVQVRIGWHIRLYKDIVRDFICNAIVYRLTGQPLRHGGGDRWAGFQYSKSDQQHLLFVFRLDGAEQERSLRFQHLAKEKLYTLNWLTKRRKEERTGEQLMAGGLTFVDLEEEDSEIIHLS